MIQKIEKSYNLKSYFLVSTYSFQINKTGIKYIRYENKKYHKKKYHKNTNKNSILLVFDGASWHE